ncbi:transcriptional regulator with XRE-family HTH domain [Chryseobacterium sediminis]|uniref:Transcriptional regulator with XRE-family HTH domain n=1 Tax=Chryseobacterium sediminis TaxID=1679494 RepID=A0ABR6Q5H1_9FLAO|nr:helix-turn-helix transcriptional regulator [Chryseobacterium sediminis]MBB6333207.1 transcriptional regulator with XRE-family HTH domain [Chryseobacterium sediminis]
MKFGQKLKKVRESMKLSQDDLASSLNTTQKTISNWESDKGLPTLTQFACIEEILQVDILSWFEEIGVVFKQAASKRENSDLTNHNVHKLIEQYEKRIVEKDICIDEQKEIIKALIEKLNLRN